MVVFNDKMLLLEKWVSRWLSAVGARGWSTGTIDTHLDITSSNTSSPSGLNEYGLNEHSLTEYTLAEVADHRSPDSCWLVLWDIVFDVTHFIKEHPGSEEVMLENAGTDATTVFCDVGHSRDAVAMLAQYTVGILSKAERLYLRDKNQ